MFVKSIIRFFSRFKISILLGLLLSGFGWQFVVKSPTNLKVSLLVEKKSEKSDIGAIFCDDGKGYRAINRVDLEYSKEHVVGESLYKFKVKLPCGNSTKSIRFDPVWGDGQVKLKEFSIRTYRWFDIDVTQTGSKTINAVNSIEKLEYFTDGVLIKSAGIDPIVELLVDVPSYFRFKVLDVIFIVLILGVVFSLAVKFLQLTVSYFLIKGMAIESLRKKIELYIDRAIERFAINIGLAIKTRKQINWVGYLFSIIVSLASAINFVNSLYDFPTIPYVGAFFGTLLLFSLLILLIILCDLLFFGNNKSWLLPSLAILVAILLFVDTELFKLNGMHLSHGASLLLDGGVQNFQRNLEFTKLSKELLYLYEFGAVILIVLAISIGVAGKKYSTKYTLESTFLRILGVLVFCISLIVIEQFLSQYTKLPKLWAQEQSDSPFYVRFFEANNYIFSLPAKINVSVSRSKVSYKTASPNFERPLRNIYLFIMESVRSDMITEEVAPNIYKFKQENIVFEKGLANGNATHYGWYSIINSRLPISWEHVKNNKAAQGSQALRILKNIGYQVNVFTSKDLSYLDSKSILFNENELCDWISPPFSGSIPEADFMVAKELNGRVGESGKGAPSINIVMWDSSHYPYRWPEGMIDTFNPYIGAPDSGVNLNKARRLAVEEPELIINRYRNSIKYLDSLFGGFISTLKDADAYEDSIIVVVGDHGQQFMEHNYLMHGRSMYSEDLHVPLYFKLPGYKNFLTGGVVGSQVDIMPTLFSSLGIDVPLRKFSDGADLTRRNISSSFAVSAAAGFKNTPYKFLLESADKKVLFEIDRFDPSNAKTIYVTDVLTNFDEPMHTLGGVDAVSDEIGYERFLEKLKVIPFISKL